MTMRHPSRLRGLRRLLGDRRGIAATEFALLIPALLLLLYGAVEIGNALLLSRKITSATQTAADLVAQELTMDSTKMTEIFNAINEVMRPFSTTGAGYVVSSVRRDPGTDTVRVVWSQAFGSGTARAVNSTPASVPITMFASLGDTLILAELKYTYVPLLGDLIFSANFVTGDSAYLRPRRVQSIPFS
jgi:Flp pilus assembly protein TadG